MLATPPAPPLRRRGAGPRDRRPPPPAEDPPPGRDATSLHDCRPGVPSSGSQAALPGPVEELPGPGGHPRPVAPRPLAGTATWPVSAVRSSPARSLDQASDPSPGPGEPQVGIPQDQGGAPEARHRRLGHDHRHGASPRRPRAGATADWAHLEAVPEGAGLRPALQRASIRRGGRLGSPGGGSAAGSAVPGQRPLGDRPRHPHP